MLIDVAFTPSEVQAIDSKVCVVVDVIRASSSLTVICSKKPETLILTTTIKKSQVQSKLMNISMKKVNMHKNEMYKIVNSL